MKITQTQWARINQIYSDVTIRLQQQILKDIEELRKHEENVQYVKDTFVIKDNTSS